MKNCSLIILCICFLSAAAAATTTQAETSNVFQIVLGLPHQNEDAFESKFWRISTPNTKEYLKHFFYQLELRVVFLNQHLKET